MAGYQSITIAGNKQGLVQERQEFILPHDAYPVLENAYVWREQIRRKQGYQLLGRLRRVLTSDPLGVTDAGGAFSGNYRIIRALQPNSELEPGSVVIYVGAQTFVEASPPNGTLSNGAGGTGTINYITMDVSFQTSPSVGGGVAITTAYNYFPGFPVTGLRSRELTGINSEQLVAFDNEFAYRFVGTGWQEFLPGTFWGANGGGDTDFFWTTNYWVDSGNRKIFWATNNSGTSGDPIRYTNGVAGTNWINFSPQVNSSSVLLTQCLAMLPFRGRMMAFNTLEGLNLGASISYPQRIRWAAIGNPFDTVSAIVTTVNANAWRDDIRGQGGYLDIPTAQEIVSVGFVRDNLVIYCESSTWQLRYTGNSIAPFQIEKVNSELGAESTFSAVQFDTSLVGIGDKGVVQCDSFQSKLIDTKIPDLVFQFNNLNSGSKRVHGIRDFVRRLAYWTYPYVPGQNESTTYPNRRLVYNYENDSWAIFTDSLTCLGTYQPQVPRTWATSTFPWREANFPWINRPALIPSIVGGNQQGFVEYLDAQTTNDISLSIFGITGNTTTATVINSPNHNLETGAVIEISDILTGTPFASLNGNKFGVVVTSPDNFQLYTYSTQTTAFSDPQLDLPATYIGGGKIAIRDNFIIQSKKFNYLDKGQNIQMGSLDILMPTTADGAITLQILLDYNTSEPVNMLPQNASNDSFFNMTIPTSSPGGLEGQKTLQKFFCPVRGAFITLQYTLSNAQMIGPEQESDVQIDGQVLWVRPAGRLQTSGV